MRIEPSAEHAKKARVIFDDYGEQCAFVSEAVPLFSPTGFRLYIDYLRAIPRDAYPRTVEVRNRTLGRAATRLENIATVLPGPEPDHTPDILDITADVINQYLEALPKD